MNEVTLMGRLVRDPEIREGDDDFIVATYTLAVDRPYKNKKGEREADFIRCIAFGGNAEFAETYLEKGMPILVNGSIRTGSYLDKEGKTVYSTDVVVQSHYFVLSQKPKEEDEKPKRGRRK